MWSFFWTWFGFLCAQVSSGYFETKSREKFSILSLKPRSHVRILIYRTWAKRLVLEAEHWPSGCPHVSFSVTCSLTCPHTSHDNWQKANFVFSYGPGTFSMIGEANARQNTNNHKKIAAQSLENDGNHENSKISKLKLYQCRLCFKEQKLWEDLVVLTEKWKKKKKEKRKNHKANRQ